MKKYIDLVLQKSPQLPKVAKGAPSKKTLGKGPLKKNKTMFMIMTIVVEAPG